MTAHLVNGLAAEVLIVSKTVACPADLAGTAGGFRRFGGIGGGAE